MLSPNQLGLFPRGCPRCGTAITTARGRTNDGAWQVFPWCSGCQARTGNNIPHDDIDNFHLLPVVWDRLGGNWGTCEVCGNYGVVENHHWAPKALFGEEAEQWPQSNLCKQCHERWHRVISGRTGPVERSTGRTEKARERLP